EISPRSVVDQQSVLITQEPHPVEDRSVGCDVRGYGLAADSVVVGDGQVLRGEIVAVYEHGRAAGRAVAAGVAAVVHDHRAVRGGAETLQRDIGLVHGNGHDLAVGGRLDRDGDRPGVARRYRVDRGLDRRVLTGAVRGYCRRSGGGA